MPIGPRVCPIDQVTGRDVIAAARLWRMGADRASSLVAECAQAIGEAVQGSTTPETPGGFEEAVVAACGRLSEV